MITKPLTREEFIDQLKRGQIGSDEILINENTIEGGNLTVYVSISESYWPYDFVFKRHHIEPTRSVVVAFNVTSIKDRIMYGSLADNNGFAKAEGLLDRPGRFNKNQLIENQNWDKPELLGKWDKDKKEIPEKCPWGDAAFDKKTDEADSNKRDTAYYSNLDNVRHDLQGIEKQKGNGLLRKASGNSLRLL